MPLPEVLCSDSRSVRRPAEVRRPANIGCCGAIAAVRRPAMHRVPTDERHDRRELGESPAPSPSYRIPAQRWFSRARPHPALGPAAQAAQVASMAEEDQRGAPGRGENDSPRLPDQPRRRWQRDGRGHRPERDVAREEHGDEKQRSGDAGGRRGQHREDTSRHRHPLATMEPQPGNFGFLP